jgi:hypothetical protein
MSFYFSPSDIPGEKSSLLPERLNTNVIPFPSILTSRSPPTPTPSPQTSPLFYQDPILPHPITDNTPHRSRWKNPLAWAALQAIMSGSASFWGWDMIAGCVFYEPNPLYAKNHICSSSNRTGLLLSIILAFAWSVMFNHYSSGRNSPHPHRIFCTLLFLGPITALLLGVLGAFVMLGDLGPQGIMMLNVLSALCACLSIFMAVVGNVFD